MSGRCGHWLRSCFSNHQDWGEVNKTTKRAVGWSPSPALSKGVDSRTSSSSPGKCSQPHWVITLPSHRAGLGGGLGLEQPRSGHRGRNKSQMCRGDVEIHGQAPHSFKCVQALLHTQEDGRLRYLKNAKTGMVEV